jgi:hypothetical protein
LAGAPGRPQYSRSALPFPISSIAFTSSSNHVYVPVDTALTCEMWRPMLLSTVLSLGALPFYLKLGEAWGAEGLVLAGVLAISVNAGLTLGWARWRHAGPSLKVLFATGFRGLVITGLATGMAYWVQRGGAGTSGAIFDLALGVAVYIPTFILGVRVLGDDEMRGTLSRIGASLWRRIRRQES